MSGEDLAVHLAEAREELFNLRFQNATGRLDNYKRLRTLRREVARIETIIREAELGIERATPEETEVAERPRRRLFRRNPVEQTEAADDSEDADAEADEADEADAVDDVDADAAESGEEANKEVEPDDEEQE
ncbi:MAG: 50S ribosomal protein L29 [Acidobacteria bacterium]|nr:MAG: 50S ribosomal protein L29 [Acidobacteriota bacterium]